MASIYTTAEIKNFDAFINQIDNDQIDINNVLDIPDEYGRTLLQISLIGRNFKLANYLLDLGAKINHITNSGYNELQVLAGNINEDGGVELARRLIDLGCDIDYLDSKNQNSAVFTLTLNLLKSRSEKNMKFLNEILMRSKTLCHENKHGMSLYKFLETNNIEEQLKIVKEALR